MLRVRRCLIDQFLSTVFILVLFLMLARSFALLPFREVARLARKSNPLLGFSAGRSFSPLHKSLGSQTTSRALAYEDLSLDVQGEVGTKNHRTFLTRNGKRVSYWHDVPLKNGLFYNFVCEVLFYATIYYIFDFLHISLLDWIRYRSSARQRWRFAKRSRITRSPRT
jgi:hypothetical protein